MHFTHFNSAHFNSETFLRDYWQKKPLLIKNPWAHWRNPLEPDELAGLACEEDAESRLIIHTPKGLKLEHGPFPAKRFAKLGTSPYTLLVQAVDHFVPDVAALISPFRFIPNWRIDDVMVSYANDGGGVGAHFDQYDVFLIQGLGKRCWQVGAHEAGACNAATPLLPHADLRLLADFQPVAEWVLEPGDMLYVPPCVAHNGVAMGDDCMTYSMGFRAPARSELIAHYCDTLLAELEEDDRYSDAGLVRGENPGEITEAALASLHAMITERLADRQRFARWFAAYSSTPKYPEKDWGLEEPLDMAALTAELAHRPELRRNPASRFVFIRQGGGCLLCVDGESHACNATAIGFVEMLCAQDAFVLSPTHRASPAIMGLLLALINSGALELGSPD
jgi:50S ribosomal protein L16 3-hydroxylase